MTYLQDSEQETKEDETVNPESAAETTRFTGLAMPDKKTKTARPTLRGGAAKIFTMKSLILAQDER